MDKREAIEVHALPHRIIGWLSLFAFGFGWVLLADWVARV